MNPFLSKYFTGSNAQAGRQDFTKRQLNQQDVVFFDVNLPSTKAIRLSDFLTLFTRRPARRRPEINNTLKGKPFVNMARLLLIQCTDAASGVEIRENQITKGVAK
jgi:hypothetical protein